MSYDFIRLTCIVRHFRIIQYRCHVYSVYINLRFDYSKNPLKSIAKKIGKLPVLFCSLLAMTSSQDNFSYLSPWMKVTYAHISTALTTIFTAIFALMFAILSRHTLLNTACSNMPKTFSTEDLQPVPNFLYIVSFICIPLSIRLIFSIEEKRYAAAPFLWYLWCFICTFTLITGAVNFKYYLLNEYTMPKKIFMIECKASFCEFLFFNIAKCLVKNLMSYMAGTLFLSTCFIRGLYSFAPSKRSKLCITLIVFCYVIIQISVGFYTRLISIKNFSILNLLIGYLCATLSLLSYLGNQRLFMKQTNRHYQEALNKIQSQQTKDLIHDCDFQKQVSNPNLTEALMYNN